MTNTFKLILELFYPVRCACCGELSSGHDICEKCEAELTRADFDICKICGFNHKMCCCKYRNFLFDGVVSPFYNEGSAQRGIYGLKFKEGFSATKYFADEMAKAYRRNFSDIVCNAVTYVPMHKSKKRRRGYDQSYLLAKYFAKQIGVKLDKKLIVKHTSSKTQHELSFAERVKNVSGTYAVKKDLYGKTVVLVDDIRTSSSSLNECAKQLKLAGAEKVYCVTALVSMPEKFRKGEENGS